MAFKWKVDGTHTDLKKTSTKIVLDKSGTSLAEIISSGAYNYHIMLPGEGIHIPQNNLDNYYQGNYNYLAIYKSTLALGEKSWCLSAYNAIDYYNWFSRKSVIRDLTFTIGWISPVSSKDCSNWKASYIISNESCILPSRALAESWMRKLHQRYVDLEPFL